MRTKKEKKERKNIHCFPDFWHSEFLNQQTIRCTHSLSNKTHLLAMSLFFVSINTCSLQLTKDVKPGGSESVKERRTKPVSTGKSRFHHIV